MWLQILRKQIAKKKKQKQKHSESKHITEKHPGSPAWTALRTERGILLLLSQGTRPHGPEDWRTVEEN